MRAVEMKNALLMVGVFWLERMELGGMDVTAV